MEDILFRIYAIIYAIFVMLVYIGSFAFAFAWAFSSRFSQMVTRWYKRLKPWVRKVSKPVLKALEGLLLSLHDSFVNPVLFVYASYLAYPYISATYEESGRNFYECFSLLSWRFLMNHEPTLVFVFFVFAIWLIGFALSRKRGNEAKDKLNSTLSKTNEILERIENRLDLIEGDK